jgi:hypothetical protein
MESTKLSALLVLAMLALSSSSLALAREMAVVQPQCNSCQTGTTPSSGTPAGVSLPPVSVPKLPSLPVPSVPLPSVPLPSLPPVLGAPVTVPPVTGLPPVTLPPILGGGGSPKSPKACPQPPSSNTCPIDALKLGACVDLLGNDVHIGDANVQCCPLVKGVAGLSAAACLCTAIKAKVLDLSVYVPIALKLLVNCGCAVPPGYDCA